MNGSPVQLRGTERDPPRARPRSTLGWSSRCEATLLVLAFFLSGCAAQRPPSLDEPLPPLPPLIVDPAKLLPAPLAPDARFATPVFVGEARATEGDVTIEVRPGPYDQLSPFTRQWLGQRGICLFEIRLVNRAPQLTFLRDSRSRLVVGDRRIVPLGVDANMAGRSTGSRGVSTSELEHAYMEWRRERGLDPDSIRRRSSQAIAGWLNVDLARARVGADAQFQRMRRDLQAAHDSAPFFHDDLTECDAWLRECLAKESAWKADLSAFKENQLARAEQERANVLDELERLMHLDLARKLRLRSDNLESVELLPDGDQTILHQVFRSEPEELSAGGTLALYGIPVTFDQAGTVTRRANFEFRFQWRPQ